MSNRVIATLVGVALAGCSSVEGPADSLGSNEETIIGGTAAPQDPAVVLLAVQYPGGYFEEYCSGTLVGPQTVLTAAHCINTYGPGNFYHVIFGTSVMSRTKAVRVASQHKNPCYKVSSAACPNNVQEMYYDFGLLKLEQPVLDIAPIEMNTAAMTTAQIGKMVRHVGFGVTESGSSGRKLQTTYPLRYVQQLSIESGETNSQTCSGDSGGPAFMVMPGSPNEKLVGVVSFGDKDCKQFGVDGRVDVVFPWIQSTMNGWEIPTCAEDGRCAPNCTQPDPDCACIADGQCTAQCTNPARDPDCPANCARNGICATENCPILDQDCVAQGATCTKPESCQSRECIRDGQNAQSYCSARCQADGDCARGLKCGPVGLCILKPKTSRNAYEACDEYEDICLGTNVCTGPQGGITRCVKPCNSQVDCDASTTCEAGANGKKYCRPGENALRFFPLEVPQASLSGTGASGCSATGGASTAALWVTLLLVLRSASRRRGYRPLTQPS